MRQKLTDEEKRVTDAFANLVSVDVRAYSNTSLATLGYEGIIKAIAKTIKLSFEETRNLLMSSIEKNSSEFTRYFIKHSS
jgi:hypothetical protein